MPGARGHDLHVDTHLTNIAINYAPKGLIADQIAPIVTVGKQSDSYPIWDQGDILRVEAAHRAPGTEARLIYRRVSSDTYFADNYALKLRVALQCTSTSNVYSSTAVESAWTGYANAVPKSMIDTGMDVIEDTSGIRPNSILFAGQAWRNFRRCDEVTDELYGTAGGAGKPRSATREQAKAIFEVDRLLVGEAYYNTAAEGQTASLSPVWGDHVLIYYAPPAPSLDEASYMYSFRWKRPGLANLTVERHPFDPKIKSEEVELGVYQDEKLTSTALAYLITNVTSST
jgi:hypothetical protein